MASPPATLPRDPPLCFSLGLGPRLVLALTHAVAPACLQDALSPSLGILREVRAVQEIWVDTEGQDLGGQDEEVRHTDGWGQGDTSSAGASPGGKK